MSAEILADYNVRVKTFAPTDPRLGRHVRHDSRSLAFLYPATLDRSTLVSKRHISYVPVLDQGNLGSCTGNASTKCLSYDPFWGPTIEALLSPLDTTANEIFAVGVYSDATKIDPWSGSYPPEDTGSDGLSVAKVLKNRGLISGYQHATTMDAVLNALQTRPVIVGTSWRSDMFNPASDGQLRITGNNEGGHEYVLDEIDVQNKRVWMQNSWSDDWGIDGRAYFTWDDFETLLDDDGDCTIFVPVALPAPTPEPPAPEPTPVPPSPVPPTPSDLADQTLAGAIRDWVKHRKLSRSNELVRKALVRWLNAKDL